MKNKRSSDSAIGVVQQTRSLLSEIRSADAEVADLRAENAKLREALVLVRIRTQNGEPCWCINDHGNEHHSQCHIARAALRGDK